MGKITWVKLRVGRYCIAHGEPLDSGRTEHASGWGRFIVYIETHDQADTDNTERSEQKTIGEICLESRWRDLQPRELDLDFIIIRASPGYEPFSTFAHADVEKDKATDLVPKADSRSSETDRSTASNE